MKRATYDDVLSAPEHKVAEILDGELVLSPRPTPRHAVAFGRLLGDLGGPCHPIERTLEVLRLRDGAWTIVAVFTETGPVRAPQSPFSSRNPPIRAA